MVRASEGGIRVSLPNKRTHVEWPPSSHRLSLVDAVEILFPTDNTFWKAFPRTLRLSFETAQLVQGSTWDPAELRPRSVPAYYRDLVEFAARWPNATVVAVFQRVLAEHGLTPTKYLEAIYFIANQRAVFNPYGFSARYGFEVTYVHRQPRSEPEILFDWESSSDSSIGSGPDDPEAEVSSDESTIGMDTVE